MKIYKIRGLLYKAAKYLGDFTAISKSIKSKSAEPIIICICDHDDYDRRNKNY